MTDIAKKLRHSPARLEVSCSDEGDYFLATISLLTRDFFVDLIPTERSD